MSPSALSTFNQLKARTLLALHPAEVEFAHQPGLVVSVSLGEVSDQPALHESGQSVQHARTAALYWPLFTPQPGAQNPPAFVPAFGHVFTVRTARNEALVGTRWRLGDSDTASGEALMRFACRRVES